MHLFEQRARPSNSAPGAAQGEPVVCAPWGASDGLFPSRPKAGGTVHFPGGLVEAQKAGHPGAAAAR